MSRIAPGTMIVVIFAILLGLVGAYAVQRQLAEKPEPVAEPAAEEPQPQIVRIPMAAADLEEGRTITMGDVAMVAGTMEQLNAAYDLPAEYMRDSRQIIGRTIKAPMVKGGTFKPGDFYPEGTGPNVAARLQPGKRAITIRAGGADAINGFASPSSMVDVLFRTEETDDYPETTVTLVEGAEVLALDRTLERGAHGEQVATVTLSVSSQQANALKIAENKGAFSLALRNAEDDTLPVSTGKPQTLKELLNLPEKNKPFQAEVYRGSSKSTLQFEQKSDDRVRVANPIIEPSDDAQSDAAPAGQNPVAASGS